MEYPHLVGAVYITPDGRELTYQQIVGERQADPGFHAFVARVERKQHLRNLRGGA